MRPASFRSPLGMLEWDSIARGMEAADALLKEAEVRAVAVRPVTPGRYVALFTGEVEAVRASLRRGAEVGSDAMVDSLFLPQPHPDLMPALGARTGVSEAGIAAVGVIETLSLCSLLVAADGAAKTGDVRLVEIRLGMGLGGKAFAVLTGEVSQVESAVAQGTGLARDRGHHLRSVVIPRPDPRMATFFTNPTNPFSDFLI